MSYDNHDKKAMTQLRNMVEVGPVWLFVSFFYGPALSINDNYFIIFL